MSNNRRTARPDAGYRQVVQAHKKPTLFVESGFMQLAVTPLDNGAANGVLSTLILVRGEMCAINCNRVYEIPNRCSAII